MNLFIARNPLQYFDYQLPKVKVALLQKLAPKQELILANFSQHPDWYEVSNGYLAKYSKALALMDYLHFFEVISSLKLIYKNSINLEDKAFIGMAYSRPPPLAKTTVMFPDGRCFYDYLETWLYGYYKTPEGSWRSCGAAFKPGSQEVGRLWLGRLQFDPVGELVFVRHNGTPFAEDSMASYISTAAHALTGQRLTPHLLRDIFATHFLDRGASDSDIASLAYAMAHSPQVLRTNYDRRCPAQKHRPIQSAVLDLVQQSFHPD